MPGEPKSPVAENAASGKCTATPEIEIYFVDLVRVAAVVEDEEARTPRLSAADIERAAAMADREARGLWRASRIATRILLERAGGTDLRRRAFHIEAGGRPVLDAGSPYFSVSHTNGVALVAVAKAVVIGVDLEAKTRVLRMSAERRRRIIQAAQGLGPQASLSAEQDGDVLIAWVQLEAAAKALGIGIGRLLTQEGVVGGSKAKSSPQQRDLEVRSMSVGTDYVGGVAAQHLPNDLAVKPFPHTQLEAFLRGKSV